MSTVTELPDWTQSSRKIWPQRHFGSLAAEYAGSVAAPCRIVRGDRWSTPEAQERRRAAIMAEQDQFAHYHDQAARAQEERINREERERFAARHAS